MPERPVRLSFFFGLKARDIKRGASLLNRLIRRDDADASLVFAWELLVGLVLLYGEAELQNAGLLGDERALRADEELLAALIDPAGEGPMGILPLYMPLMEEGVLPMAEAISPSRAAGCT